MELSWKICNRSFSLSLSLSFQVWFQNRRMKDKRQRMSLAACHWPHHLPPIDPHFYSLLLSGRIPYPCHSAVSPHLNYYPQPLPGTANPSYTAMDAYALQLRERAELVRALSAHPYAPGSIPLGTDLIANPTAYRANPALSLSGGTHTCSCHHAHLPHTHSMPTPSTHSTSTVHSCHPVTSSVSSDSRPTVAAGLPTLSSTHVAHAHSSVIPLHATY